MSEHLEPFTFDRGRRYLLPIWSDDVGVMVHESSAADSPHVWLTLKAPQYSRGAGLGINREAIHLTVEDARKLAEQLTWLCDNHYQNGDDSE